MSSIEQTIQSVVVRVVENWANEFDCDVCEDKGCVECADVESSIPSLDNSQIITLAANPNTQANHRIIKDPTNKMHILNPMYVEQSNCVNNGCKGLCGKEHPINFTIVGNIAFKSDKTTVRCMDRGEFIAIFGESSKACNYGKKCTNGNCILNHKGGSDSIVQKVPPSKKNGDVPNGGGLRTEPNRGGRRAEPNGGGRHVTSKPNLESNNGILAKNAELETQVAELLKLNEALNSQLVVANATICSQAVAIAAMNANNRSVATAAVEDSIALQEKKFINEYYAENLLVRCSINKDGTLKYGFTTDGNPFIKYHDGETKGLLTTCDDGDNCPILLRGGRCCKSHVITNNSNLMCSELLCEAARLAKVPRRT
jgi:hypothetical protein